MPPNANGLWCYIESYGYWVCLTKTIQGILSPNGIKSKSATEKEFVSSLQSIITNLNETYNKVEETMINEIKDFSAQTEEKLRLALLGEVNSVIKNDKGDPYVRIIPTTLIEEMLANIDNLEGKLILVMYNHELIEQLINKKKIDPKKITFATSTNGLIKTSALSRMYGVDSIVFSSEPSAMHRAFTGRKFDVCLSNPPYNRGLDLKILQALMSYEIAKEYVWVHPSTWLLDQKNIFALYSKTKASLNNKLKSVRFFNGNAVFGIELFVPCVVSHIDVKHNDKINVQFFDEHFVVNSIGDITKFGNNWHNIVKPFMTKMLNCINKDGSVWAHNVKAININKEYCQLAAIRGDVNDRNKKSNATNASKEIIKDNFYTMTVDVETCKGIRQSNLTRPGNPTPTFEFNTVIERDNFLHYINTDFARFCLAIYKNTSNLAVGEMELIPWLDFTQSWNDEKLFAHFDVNNETQEYIRKFLPDYYRIRK